MLGRNINMDDIAKILEELKQQSPLMYHPIHERSDMAWFPSNDASQLVVIISNAWEDILCISQIRKQQDSDYKKKLLFKYELVELRSVIKNIEKLQSIVFKTIDNANIETDIHGSISEEQAGMLKESFKNYHIAKNKVETDLLDIRNKLGAHRDSEEIWKIGTLWDKLDPILFAPLLIEIPKLFGLLKNLDIYDWTRIPDNDSIEIYTSGLGDFKFTP